MKNENNLEKLKVLIIDDDEEICILLKEFCSILNLESEYITDPTEIEKILSQKSFHIILLDQHFPGLKGIDLLKRGYLKPEEYYIVMMTGMPLNEITINNMLKLGVNEFFQKPLTLNDLRKILFHAKASITEKLYFLEATKKLEKATMEFIIDNDITLVGAISKMILRNIEGFNFTENPKFLLTGLVEAISNAIIHGNLELSSSYKDKGFDIFQKEIEKRLKDEKFKNRKVFISTYLDRKIFKIKIRDEGKGFDWRAYLKKMEQMELLSSYGRGIPIIRNVFDEVYWNDKGNEIILIKHPLTLSVEQNS